MLLTRGDVIDAAEIDAFAMQHRAPENGASSAPVDPDTALNLAVQRWLRSRPASEAADAGDLHGALVRRIEQLLIDEALARTGGNQLKAAALLGINRNTLRQKRHG